MFELVRPIGNGKSFLAAPGPCPYGTRTEVGRPMVRLTLSKRSVSESVHDEELSMVLSEFARTLITDLPIEGMLDRFVKRIVEVMPITSAGVTLMSAGTSPHCVAASDRSALACC